MISPALIWSACATPATATPAKTRAHASDDLSQRLRTPIGFSLPSLVARRSESEGSEDVACAQVDRNVLQIFEAAGRDHPAGIRVQRNLRRDVDVKTAHDTARKHEVRIDVGGEVAAWGVEVQVRIHLHEADSTTEIGLEAPPRSDELQVRGEDVTLEVEAAVEPVRVIDVAGEEIEVPAEVVGVLVEPLDRHVLPEAVAEPEIE